MTEKIVQTPVTEAELVEAYGGFIPGGDPTLVFVSCPANYDALSITADDIVHDQAIVKLHPRAIVSTRQVRDGGLPAHADGVRWFDTDWTECREHLEHPAWAAAVEASDEPTGLALSGDVACDACAEARRGPLAAPDPKDPAMPDITLTIPDEAWEATAEYRRYATLNLNGTLMHVEAFEVYPDRPGDECIGGDDDTLVQRVAEAVGAEGPFDTTEINGREYVVVITPYC